MQSDLHKIIVSPQHLSTDHIKVFLYQILRGDYIFRPHSPSFFQQLSNMTIKNKQNKNETVPY